MRSDRSEIPFFGFVSTAMPNLKNDVNGTAEIGHFWPESKSIVLASARVLCVFVWAIDPKCAGDKENHSSECNCFSFNDFAELTKNVIAGPLMLFLTSHESMSVPAKQAFSPFLCRCLVVAGWTPTDLQ